MRPKRKILKPIENKSGGIGVVSLATYTSPKIVEVRNQDWINYGEDNNYFGYLQDRINGSPTNNAIVNGISQMIFGQGLDSTEKLIKPDEWAEVQLLFDNDTVERLGNDLEAMGNCAIQVVYSIDRTRILECNHFPVETLRSGKCNEEGDIEFYYYSEDWTKVTRTNKPLAIPSFGTSSESEEILYIKPYKTGFYYYSPVSYQGCLQYCEIEEEVSNFHLNNILNGMAPSMLINFLNGTPTETEQREIERNIQNKFSGTSNSGKFILNFSDGANTASTITPIQLSDAHNQYQFLADEAMRKIMVGHRIISPMLLGIKDNSGFGNNADELQTATILMQNTVIKPVQNLLIKHFDKVLAFNENTIKVIFKDLQPLDASNELTITDKSNTIIDGINSLSPLVANKVLESMTPDEIRALVGLKSAIIPEVPTENLSAVDLSQFGEEIDLEKYELISSNAVNYENETDLDSQMHELNATHLASASTGVAKTKSKSEQDSDLYITRYRYSGNGSPEREFCKKMMSANKLYRKEDIENMSKITVNPGFGMSPEPDKPYDIFLWKGGGLLSEEFPNGTCKHFWTREMYRKIGSGKNTAAIPSTPAEVRKNGEIAPTNDNRAYQAPHDMK